jgi:hypothetical protein
MALAAEVSRGRLATKGTEDLPQALKRLPTKPASGTTEVVP